MTDIVNEGPLDGNVEAKEELQVNSDFTSEVEEKATTTDESKAENQLENPKALSHQPTENATEETSLPEMTSKNEMTEITPVAEAETAAVNETDEAAEKIAGKKSEEKPAEPDSLDRVLAGEIVTFDDDNEDAEENKQKQSDQSSSDSDSGDDSDSDSSDDETGQIDDNEDNSDGEYESAQVPHTKNEILDEPAPSVPTDFHLTSDMPIEYVGELQQLVEKSAIISAAGSGEFRILSDKSILCFEDRQILGVVYETFGRVQSPMYSVKFNTEEETKNFESRKGAKVFYVVPGSSFTLTETVRAVKGSDASNLHDEEIPEEEQEFSDDEKEMQSKRGKKKKDGQAKKKKRKTNGNAMNPANQFQNQPQQHFYPPSSSYNNYPNAHQYPQQHQYPPQQYPQYSQYGQSYSQSHQPAYLYPGYGPSMQGSYQPPHAPQQAPYSQAQQFTPHGPPPANNPQSNQYIPMPWLPQQYNPSQFNHRSNLPYDSK